MKKEGMKRVHKNVNSTMNLIDKLDINSIPDPSCLWLPVEARKTRAQGAPVDARH